MKILFTIFFLYTSSFLLFSQTTVIQGIVYDNASKEVMPFVNVGLKNSTAGGPTNINGKYFIKTTVKSDSLVVKYVGYHEKHIVIKRGVRQKIDIYLEPSRITVKEVKIKYKGNPAYKVLKQVQKNKVFNDKDKYKTYSYDAYNKIQIDLADVTKELMERKRYKKFNFIFNNVDTFLGKKVLPLLISETTSKYYYKKFPKTKKEIILANKMSGLENPSLIKYMASINNNINVYDNSIIILGKGFLSPIAPGAKLAYHLYLDDSLNIDGRYSYQITFKPRNKNSMLFQGVMYIDKETYAVKLINGEIGTKTNINFVEGVKFSQEFELVGGKNWMLKKEKTSVNMTIESLKAFKINSAVVHKTSFYSNITVDANKIDSIADRVLGNVLLAEDVQKKTDEYWEKNRPEKLSKKEEGIYIMIDSLKKNKRFILYKEGIKSLPTGLIDIGKVAFGSYYKAFSVNSVEGFRINLGARTTKRLFTNTQFLGNIAYGFRDETFKFGFITKHTFKRNPWRNIIFKAKSDIEQYTINSQGSTPVLGSGNNIFSTLFSRAAINRLVFNTEVSLTSEYQITGRVNFFPLVKYSISQPKGVLSLVKEEQKTAQNGNLPFLTGINTITTFEVGATIRISFNENFVTGNFRRRSLSSRKPITEVYYLAGIKGVINSQYNYHKIGIRIRDKNELASLGYVRWRFAAEKIFGTLPYTLLKVHEGNNSYFNNPLSYNLMRPFEFVSDQHISLKVDYHFDGLIFNQFPFLKDLGIRTFVEGKAVYGVLSDRHTSVAEFFSGTRKFNNIPYVEAGLGIENIFQFLRLGVLWRFTHTDTFPVGLGQKSNNFGVNFGVSIKI